MRGCSEWADDSGACPVAPGSWKDPGLPPLYPLHLDLEAPGAAHGYTSMATMSVNLVGGYGDGRAL
jgi:hypothetical protein